MKKIVLLLLLLVGFAAHAQSSYTGFLGKHAITLVAYHYSDGYTRAYYTYNTYDTPIPIDGKKVEERLELYEKDEAGKVQAILSIQNFSEEAHSLEGVWKSVATGKTYKISLQKEFSLAHDDKVEWRQKELLQMASTDKHYFKTIITKSQEDFYGRVSGVKIFEKKTDRLLQHLALDCQLLGVDNVTLGDFNFDGHEDFSVFEASYAGPNTSSIYVLWHPDSGRYVISDFAGTSLDFDAESELIHEHNQCCAGSRYMTATYKVVDNHMVLLERKCFEWDGETGEQKEVVCSE